MPFRYEMFLKELIDLVESGEIPMARIDDAVERILRVKFVAGLFEYPFSDRSLIETVGCKVSAYRIQDMFVGPHSKLLVCVTGKHKRATFLFKMN